MASSPRHAAPCPRHARASVLCPWREDRAGRHALYKLRGGGLENAASQAPHKGRNKENAGPQATPREHLKHSAAPQAPLKEINAVLQAPQRHNRAEQSLAADVPVFPRFLLSLDKITSIAIFSPATDGCH
eukprot:gene10928-biopygen21355